MPTPWKQTLQASNPNNTTLTNATETSVLTLPNVNTNGPNQPVALSGSIEILTGATVTSIALRIYRGTIATGVLVGTAVFQTAGAAVSQCVAINVTDNPGEVAGQLYTMSLTQTGGSSNGTCQNAGMQAVIG